MSKTPNTTYPTATSSPCSTCLCQISQSKILLSCLAALSVVKTTPGFKLPTIYSSFSLSTGVLGSSWINTHLISVQTILLEKTSIPTLYTSRMNPSSSSIVMTILTNNSSTKNRTNYFYTIPLRVRKYILHLQLHILASNTYILNTSEE
jgi:hypothetical protein